MIRLVLRAVLSGELGIARSLLRARRYRRRRRRPWGPLESAALLMLVGIVVGWAGLAWAAVSLVAGIDPPGWWVMWAALAVWMTWLHHAVVDDAVAILRAWWRS